MPFEVFIGIGDNEIPSQTLSQLSQGKKCLAA